MSNIKAFVAGAIVGAAYIGSIVVLSKVSITYKKEYKDTYLLEKQDDRSIVDAVSYHIHYEDID